MWAEIYIKISIHTLKNTKEVDFIKYLFANFPKI